jgi:hypothetical protein
LDYLLDIVLKASPSLRWSSLLFHLLSLLFHLLELVLPRIEKGVLRSQDEEYYHPPNWHLLHLVELELELELWCILLWLEWQLE